MKFKRVVAAALAVPALALGTAAQAAAEPPPPIAPRITALYPTALLQDGGNYVGFKVSYRCDPSTGYAEMRFRFRQVINGRNLYTFDYFYPKFCTGKVQTSWAKVRQPDGFPRWRLGTGWLWAHLTTASSPTDPESEQSSNSPGRKVTVVRP